MSAKTNLQQNFPVPIAGFLAKPFEIDALLHLIAALIRLPTADQEAHE
ncbi:MAG: hypothetical protein ABIV47_19655 [Roseiflexaceae bacterium]